MIFTLVSCSAVNMVTQKTTIKATTSILTPASLEFETESDWEMFKLGSAGNLKLMEGLLFIDKNNSDLLANLARGYSVYGLIVYDTEYLDDLLLDNDREDKKKQTIYAYSKAIRYGLRYLEENDISYEQLVRASRKENGVADLFNEELDDDEWNDIALVFFLGQAWIGLLNIQKDNMTLMSQLGIVKALFDWSCKSRKDFYFGGCDVFYGAYEMSRPKMLGGNPEKGVEHFKKAILNYPQNLFNRVAYVQYALIPAMDKKQYLQQKKFLRKAFKEFEEKQNWGGRDSRFKQDNLNLLNTLAKKRFEIIEKHEKNIF